MKYAALICARGGSKGLPRKNILPFAGKSLIAWAVSHALQVAAIEKVVVSTDCPEIAAAARDAGADVPFLRPAELAQDDSPEWNVWRHALLKMIPEGTSLEGLVVVPPTAPLREPVDIERCISEFARGEADVVITVTEAHRSPYFNMVARNPDGTVRLVISPDGNVFRRQDAPPVFDITTVAYVARPAFVLGADRMLEGVVRAVTVPVERSLDIDTLLDFKVGEFLMSERRN